MNDFEKLERKLLNGDLKKRFDKNKNNFIMGIFASGIFGLYLSWLPPIVDLGLKAKNKNLSKEDAELWIAYKFGTWVINPNELIEIPRKIYHASDLIYGGGKDIFDLISNYF